MADFTIRPIRAEDAEGVNLIRRSPGVMKYTMSIPSDRVEANRRYLENLGRGDHVLVAVADGEIVGIAGLHEKRGKERHVAELGISVRDDFWGRGIGRALMEALLDIADNYLGLVRVELEVLTGNKRAIALYESLGFKEEGIKRKAVYRAGEYLDFMIMGRIRDEV